jgi:hypothetical protein
MMQDPWMWVAGEQAPAAPGHQGPPAPSHQAPAPGHQAPGPGHQAIKDLLLQAIKHLQPLLMPSRTSCSQPSSHQGPPAPGHQAIKDLLLPCRGAATRGPIGSLTDSAMSAGPFFVLCICSFVLIYIDNRRYIDAQLKEDPEHLHVWCDDI